MRVGVVTFLIGLWSLLCWGSEIPYSAQLQQSCVDALTDSREWDDGLGDRKWDHFWISERVVLTIQKDYSIQPGDLRKAITWVREAGPSVQNAHPQAVHFAVIEVPGRGKFRLRFRARGPGLGTRILGLTSLTDLTSKWAGPWQISPEAARVLTSRVFGWSQRDLESQAQLFGGDLSREPEELGLVIHFNSSLGAQEKDLQIAFTRQQLGYSVTAFDSTPLFYLASNIRDKLKGKHQVNVRSLVEIFSRWDKKAAPERRVANLERGALPRYWMIAQTSSGRLVKVVFAWDAKKQLPIIISTFDASLKWMLAYDQEAQTLK